ncbi:glycoside hydrolase superfamily [Naematelia encephala]|uniref:Glycoside hydrolase superfamily n=1 Tax=Naematelia encephala TaxID=71784 RepID=A0A1Y2BFY6_9TREE|nr:glycoside hydrolase superfamily [Naematelia encephala]
MEIFIQEVSLDAELKATRVPIAWSPLQAASDWKVISFIRNKPTWIEPRSQTSLSTHPALASTLILLKSPDWSTTLAIYPISTLQVNNNLVVATSSNAPVIHANVRRVKGQSKEKAWVLCAEARNRQEERNIVKRLVDEARKLVGGRPKKDLGRTESTLWDGLGICTWESFGGSSRVPDRPTKHMLLELVPSFPIKTYLIDDGWQDIRGSPDSERRLYSFHEWGGMGASMTEVVSSLKGKGVEKVGVWLTLQGYWDSIDPQSPLCDRYACVAHPVAKPNQPRGGVKVPLEAGDQVQYLPHPTKAAEFWKDWFIEIKSWGIDFVKVDNQAHFNTIVSPTSAETHQAMWSGMLSAAVEVLGSLENVIMCMSHNERMLNGPGGLDFARPPGNLVFRTSRFRLPQYHTSVLTRELSLIPDFDMFATNPPNHLPTYHALLRALSPGPILISDTPDVLTDRALTAKLTARDKSGNVKVVKARVPATVLSGRWFWDNLISNSEGPAMIASTPMPEAHGAILGAWNGHDVRAIDRITLRDVEDALDLDGGGLTSEFALWSVGHSRNSGQKVELLDKSWQGGMDIELEREDCEAVVLARVWDVGAYKVAVVGMLDKIACLAGISVRVEHDRLHVRTRYATKALSVLCFDRESAKSVGLTVEINNISIKPTMTTVKENPRVILLMISVGGEGEGLNRNKGHDYWEVIYTT